MTRRADHVILISIDGFRSEIYRDERWPAPVVQELARDGVIALAATSVFPAHTYPAHTTMVTGALPARHGVYHNEPFEPEGMTGRWLWEACRIRTRTLWQAVRAGGGTTAAVSWPVTVGAQIDWNLPDVWSPNDPDAIEPLRAATTPEGLLEEIEREATGRLTDARLGLSHLGREDVVGAIAAYLFLRHRPALMLMHVIGLDHVRHRLGLDNPFARRAVAAADRAVGRVLETVERLSLRERTAFLIVGDHGSVDVHTELRPNVWLAGAGCVERPAGAQWHVAFHGTGGSAFLLPSPSRMTHGESERLMAKVRAAFDNLPSGVRGLFRIVERSELDALGADPNALLALAAEPGVVFSREWSGSPVVPAQGGGHGYHPALAAMSTGFVGSGAGFRKGAVAATLPLQYIAPLAAALLELEFEAPDAVLLPGLLQ